MWAKVSPTRTWTLSLSTSLRSLVNATSGFPWVSSTMTSTFRAAICWPISSRYIASPLTMSLPIAAALPVIGASTPILIDPLWADAMFTPTAVTRASTPTTVTSSCLAIFRPSVVSPRLRCGLDTRRAELYPLHQRLDGPDDPLRGVDDRQDIDHA